MWKGNFSRAIIHISNNELLAACGLVGVFYFKIYSSRNHYRSGNDCSRYRELWKTTLTEQGI